MDQDLLTEFFTRIATQFLIGKQDAVASCCVLPFASYVQGEPRVMSDRNQIIEALYDARAHFMAWRIGQVADFNLDAREQRNHRILLDMRMTLANTHGRPVADLHGTAILQRRNEPGCFQCEMIELTLTRMV